MNLLEDVPVMRRERSKSCLIGMVEATKLIDKNDGEDSTFEGPFEMLQHRLGSLLNEGIYHGQRLAISSDLWRYPQSTPHCDLLLTFTTNNDRTAQKSTVQQIVNIIKKYEPSLRIQVRHHTTKDFYAIYLTAEYKSLLKGAELCHIKKTVKESFGGGKKEFCFEEAQCFVGIEEKNNFLSQMERSIIVKQMLELIRAPRGGLSLDLGGKEITVSEGMAIIPRLVSANIIDNMLPLHDQKNLDDLCNKWVYNMFGDQPLIEIKKYFGTEIAMYFTWLGHMTTALWFPALLGIFMYFFGGFKYKSNPDEIEKTDASQLFSDICFVFFALFNCVWSTAYLEFWKRKQAEYAFEWGTYDSTQEPFLQDPRPEFQGDYLAPNPVSARMEPFYPPWKHAVLRYGVTYPITILCVCCMFMAMLVVFEVQDSFDYYFGNTLFLSWLCQIPMIVYALMIVVSDKLYRQLALFLNDLENYRTDDEYEDFLISKIVIFQSVTAYGSLFYIAFYLRDMKRLHETLATLLITRMVTQNVLETGIPYLIESLRWSSLTYRMTRSMSDDTLRRHVEEVKNKKRGSLSSQEELPNTPTFNLESPTEGVRHRFPTLDINPLVTQQSTSSPNLLRNDSIRISSPRLPIPEFVPTPGNELNEAELQSLMPVYARPLDDYLEMFIQFGYVLLFSPAYPLAAVWALFNNLIEIRADAFKLCKIMQRPFGRFVRDIGAWQKAMEILGMVGVMVNCALIGQSGLVQRIWPEISWGGQILIVVVLEHLILASKVLIDIAIPDIPYHIRIETAKQEHHRREAFKRENRMLTGRNSSETSPCNDTNETVQMPNEITRQASRYRKKRSITPIYRHPSFKRYQNNCID